MKNPHKKEAIEVKNRELQEIFEIERSAHALAALIEAQRQKKIVFETEMERRKRELEEEIATTHDAWAREEAERGQQVKEREAFEKETAAREQELAEREKKLAEREKHQAELEKRVELFPRELEAQVNRAVKETADRRKPMAIRSLQENALLWATISVLVFLALAAPSALAEECSTALIFGAAAEDGRPILWKNRDTDRLSNKVVYVAEVPFSYLGLVNADDPSGRRVWAGLNAAGFAIENSVAYNLPSKSSEAKDLEGVVMGDALRSCRTVDDFEAYLKRNQGPDLGCQANFGVIDAAGGAALFEVHNRGYTRWNAAEFAEKFILTTNFSRSGEVKTGRGYVRFDRLVELSKSVPAGKYSVARILQDFARDLGHPYMNYPDAAARSTLPPDKPILIHTQQTIDRSDTSCAVVAQGVAPGGDPRDATLWVLLGEPVCGIAVPLWVEAADVPAELGDGEMAPLVKEAARLKGKARPFTDEERQTYLDLTRLDNAAGTGWLPVLMKKEREILEKTAAFLATRPGPAQKAEFQKQMAAEALRALQAIP